MILWCRGWVWSTETSSLHDDRDDTRTWCLSPTLTTDREIQSAQALGSRGSHYIQPFVSRHPSHVQSANLLKQVLVMQEVDSWRIIDQKCEARSKHLFPSFIYSCNYHGSRRVGGLVVLYHIEISVRVSDLSASFLRRCFPKHSPEVLAQDPCSSPSSLKQIDQKMKWLSIYILPNSFIILISCSSKERLLSSPDLPDIPSAELVRPDRESLGREKCGLRVTWVWGILTG